MARTEPNLAQSALATLLQRPMRHPLGLPSVARRNRLIICVALYGGALGAAATVISFLSRAKLQPPLYEPERLQLQTDVFLSGAGVVAGVLVVSVLAYWLIKGADSAQPPVLWLAMGLGFALMVPFVTGALVPVSIVFLNVRLGVFDPGDLSPGLLDAVFRAPHSSFSYGTVALGTTGLAALLFAAGAWLIDTVNASKHVIVSRYGACAISLALSSVFIASAFLGPPSTLAKLG